MLNSLAVTEVTQQFSNAGRCYHLLESVHGLVLIQHLSPQFHHLQQFLLLVSFTQSHTHTHSPSAFVYQSHTYPLKNGSVSYPLSNLCSSCHSVQFSCIYIAPTHNNCQLKMTVMICHLVVWSITSWWSSDDG